jgi:hypothetical protein
LKIRANHGGAEVKLWVWGQPGLYNKTCLPLPDSPIKKKKKKKERNKIIYRD